MSIRTQHIYKSFLHPKTEALHDINLEIQDHEFISIVGRSGSGKSTLLYILSTLDIATEGILEISDRNVYKLSQRELHDFRNTNMGFIFQFHNLLPDLSILENVLLPVLKRGRMKDRQDKAMSLLKKFGIANRSQHRPSEVSGGEAQRAAVARALIMDPQYIFADEPTGNLDSTNGDLVMDIFSKINKDMGTTIVMVTHEMNYAKMADRQIRLYDGKLVDKNQS